jgi:hypothetical protein
MGIIVQGRGFRPGFIQLIKMLKKNGAFAPFFLRLGYESEAF